MSAFSSHSRAGYTIKELIAAVVAVTLLVALLLPAQRRANESARRTQCSNNLKQIGLACHNYESSHKTFPSSGMQVDWETFDQRIADGKPPKMKFGLQSTFTQLLNFMEGGTLVQNYDWTKAYNDPTATRCELEGLQRATWNQFTARQQIPGFQCPSNPFLAMADPAGFAGVDYMPTVYSDIDPDTSANGVDGVRRPELTADGCLSLAGTTWEDITDGTSYTILMAESAGRLSEELRPFMVGEYPDPVCENQEMVDPLLCTKSGQRAFWRWAEPACAGGISGQRNHGFRGVAVPFVNGNKSPVYGGSKAEIDGARRRATPTEASTSVCYWSWTNCGPNDEIFAWHNAGANAVMADGAVKHLNVKIHADIMRYVITRKESPLPMPTCVSF